MAVTINFYDKAIQYALENGSGGGRIDYETDDFMLALINTTGEHTASHETWSQINSTEKIATGNGYGSANGKAMTGETVDMPTAGTVMWDADDWTEGASGGPIPSSGTCWGAKIYVSHASTADDYLICSISFGADESAGSGTDFRITWNANGIFRIS